MITKNVWLLENLNRYLALRLRAHGAFLRGRALPEHTQRRAAQACLQLRVAWPDIADSLDKTFGFPPCGELPLDQTDDDYED